MERRKRIGELWDLEFRRGWDDKEGRRIWDQEERRSRDDKESRRIGEDRDRKDRVRKCQCGKLGVIMNAFGGG